MPTAPLYNGPQVALGQGQAQGLNPNISPSQMDGGLSSSLGGIGRALGGMYIEERNKADDIAAQDAIARAQNKQTDLLYNPKTGVMFRKGADLYENARQFADDFQTEMDGIRNSLGNDRVKERFQRVRDSLWNEFNRSLSIHVNREIVDTAKTSTENFLASTKTRAMTALDADIATALPRKDDGTFNFYDWDMAVQLMEGAIGEQARRTGQGAPDVEKAIRENIGEFHVQAIRLLSEKGDTEAVKAYQEQYKAQIPHTAKATIANVIERGTAIQESQSWSDKILGMVMPDPSMPELDGKKPTLQEQEEAANRLVKDLLKDKGKLRDDVQSRVSTEFYRRHQAQKGYQEDQFNNYAARIQKNESFDIVSKEAGFSEMTVPQQLLVQNIADEKTKRKDFGRDGGKVYRYEATAFSNDPAVRDWFRSLDLTNLGLTPKEFEDLKKTQIELQKSQLSEQDKLVFESGRSVHQIASDAMSSLGWTNEDEAGRQNKYKFQKRLEEEVRAVELRTKKKAIPADVQQIADELILKAAVKGRFWGSDEKFMFELSAAEAAAPETKIAMGSITADTKERLRSQFQKTSGRMPTDNEIQSMYYNEVRLKQQTRGLNFKR